MSTPTRLTGLLVGLLAIVVAGACSSPGASSTTPLAATCDQFAATPSIQQSTHLAVGATATVDLCSNPTTGYAWETPMVADPTVVAVVSSVYQGPAEASPPLVGAAGTQVVTIRGLAAGTTTVALSYGQPWAGGQKGAWTYQLTVSVP
jgi:predicted secreted protein